MKKVSFLKAVVALSLSVGALAACSAAPTEQGSGSETTASEGSDLVLKFVCPWQFPETCGLPKSGYATISGHAFCPAVDLPSIHATWPGRLITADSTLTPPSPSTKAYPQATFNCEYLFGDIHSSTFPWQPLKLTTYGSAELCEASSLIGYVMTPMFCTSHGTACDACIPPPPGVHLVAP